jgi:hypothetical protein
MHCVILFLILSLPSHIPLQIKERNYVPSNVLDALIV